MVLETLRLLAGIFLGHNVDETMVAEIWECIVVVLGERVSTGLERKLTRAEKVQKFAGRRRHSPSTFLYYMVMCSAIGPVILKSAPISASRRSLSLLR